MNSCYRNVSILNYRNSGIKLFRTCLYVRMYVYMCVCVCVCVCIRKTTTRLLHLPSWSNLNEPLCFSTSSPLLLQHSSQYKGADKSLA